PVNRQQRSFLCGTIVPSLLCAALTMFSTQIVNGAQKEDVRAAIQVQRKALMDAVTRGDASGVAKVFATDAKFMLAGLETIAGREAIQKFWQFGLSNGLVKGLILTAVDIDGEGGELCVET